MNWEFIVDTREKYVAPRTLELYPDANLEALYAADFAARQMAKFLVGIERKELMDFVNSVQDKRIFKQIDKLHETYPVIILILEGNMDTLRKTLRRLKLKFNEGAFWGTYASIVVRDNIHICWTNSMNETIHMARNICTKIVEGKYKVPRRWKPKSKNTPQDLLKMIPGVTNEIAKQLLKRYKSVEGVAQQTQKELCSNKGVGPSLVKKIKKFLC